MGLGPFSLFKPQGSYSRSWSGDILVLAPGDLPTVSFYLRSRLQRTSEARATFVHSLETPQADFQIAAGTLVVIVRHAGASWLNFLLRHRAQLSGVAFLLDDDIPAAWRCADVPIDYGFWTSGRYWLAYGRLRQLCDRLWVSTPELARRYPHCRVRVVQPLPFSDFDAPAPPGCRRWGYHGTRVHHGELKWLVPVVAAVQDRVPDAQFEVFGNKVVKKLFDGIPRVSVLAPRPWQEYLAYCQKNALAVGVAPLLQGRFNGARSYVKAFDIARCGAVGVFSDIDPYASFLQSSGALLLKNAPALWAHEITCLLTDDRLRSDRYAVHANWLNGLGKSESLSTIINSV